MPASSTSMTSDHDRPAGPQPRSGDRGDRGGILEQNSIPVGVRWVDRPHRPPRFSAPPGLPNRLSRPVEQQRHTLARARLLGRQQMRQPVSGLIQLAVGQGAALAS